VCVFNDCFRKKVIERNAKRAKQKKMFCKSVRVLGAEGERRGIVEIK